MKELFCFWIIVQLICIGCAKVDMMNDFNNGVYNCEPSIKKVSKVWGAIFPLAFFLPEDREITDYCKANMEAQR